MTKIFCKNDVRFMPQIKIAKWVVFVIEAELSIVTILKCSIFMRPKIFTIFNQILFQFFLTFVTSLILIFLRGWKIFISICLPKSLMKGSSHCDTSKKEAGKQHRQESVWYYHFTLGPIWIKIIHSLCQYSKKSYMS